MGYIFLSIALAAGTVKAYCGKKSSNYTADIKDALLANAIRMFLCVCIGFALLLIQGQFKFIRLNLSMLAITAFSGISTAVFVVTWLLSVKNGAYMMVEVFLMLGVLIPMMAGRILFNEPVHVNGWIGIGILIVAALVMFSYNNSQKERLSPIALLLLIVCGTASGLVSLSQKLFIHTMPELPITVFNFYTYVFSFLLLVPAFLLCSKNDRQKQPIKNNPLFSKIFGYVLAMSVCLFANSYFLTKAAAHLDSARLYPLNQGCALMLSTLMSSLLFKEKITVKCTVGLALAFVGIFFINAV